ARPVARARLGGARPRRAPARPDPRRAAALNARRDEPDSRAHDVGRVDAHAPDGARATGRLGDDARALRRILLCRNAAHARRRLRPARRRRRRSARARRPRAARARVCAGRTVRAAGVRIDLKAGASDVPIFGISNNRLSSVEQTNFGTEKELQSLIEANLDAVFNCRFVATEFSTGAQHAGRIDTLALSEDNNPVIIEYKKVESSELITQSLF